MRIFNRKIHKSVAENSVVEVTECEGMRFMHLGSSTVQSGMLIGHPYMLALSYARGIMSFLLFSDNIKHAITIGLGGGSVTKYIYMHCPEIKQTVLEINKQVIEVARSHFYVPENDDRLNVIEGDGLQYLLDHPESADCLIIDAFDSHGIPPDFCTQDFFDNCFNALAAGGVFTINLWGSDKNFDIYLQRIEQSFENRVLILPTGKPGNIIVLGVKTMTKFSEKKLREHAKALEKDHKIDFSAFVDKLRDHNKHDARHYLMEFL